MRRRSLLKTMAVLPMSRRLSAADTRVWLGPEFWANPLQDWRKSGDRMECHVAGGDRNVFWLSKEIHGEAPSFKMSVRLGELAGGNPASRQGWVGFRVGMRGHFNDYRDTAIRGLGLEAGITGDGRLFIGKPADGPRITSFDDMTLTLEGFGQRLRLSAGGQSLEQTVGPDLIGGGVALVCHSGELPSGPPARMEPQAASSGKPNQQRGGSMRFWFRDWSLTGRGVVSHPERAWGPILFAQYTISAGVLKMTVQFAPMEGDEPAVELQLRNGPSLRAKVEAFSSTANFRIDRWDSSREVPYTVSFQESKYTGTVRRDPRDKNQIVVGSLTCQGDFGFAHADIARNLRVVNPDILFFTGDQLYEANGGYGIQRRPVEVARLDYLRKWYMFGWAWGEFTRNTPCICLPDDHDVYHGNLWGGGGRRAEIPRRSSKSVRTPAGTRCRQSGSTWSSRRNRVISPTRLIQRWSTRTSAYITGN